MILSTILEPLHKLLRKGHSWDWDKAQQIAFEKAKQLLTSTQVLSHYDPAKHLIMLCDASPYGIEAVLFYPIECQMVMTDQLHLLQKH